MVGKRLIELRRESHMTQRQLAEKLALSGNAVSMYERGMSTPPDDVKLRIAKLFHVSLDYLMGNTDERSPAAPTSMILACCLSQEANGELLDFLQYLKNKYGVEAQRL